MDSFPNTGRIFDTLGRISPKFREEAIFRDSQEVDGTRGEVASGKANLGSAHGLGERARSGADLNRVSLWDGSFGTPGTLGTLETLARGSAGAPPGF